MRLQNAQVRTALSLTGLLVAAVAGIGCAGKPIETTYATAPTIVAIYATDITGGGLPDILIYSASQPELTGIAPGTYGSFRVEFDQPLDGSTVSNQNDRAGDFGAASALSFCTPIGTSATAPVQFIDVDGGAAVIPSSTCFDPASNLGSFPNINLIVGNGNDFTCRTFSPATALAPSNHYAIKLAGTIKGSSGMAVSAPTGTGWSAGTYSFVTDAYRTIVAGYQDQNTGFFTLVEKQNKGWLKDLGAVASADFEMPADDTGFLLFFSDWVADDGGGLAKGMTITRETGEDFGGVVVNGGGLVAVFPEFYWEPGASYKVTIPATVVSDSGVTIDKAYEYHFKAAAGTPKVRSITPSDGSTNVGLSTATTFTITFTDPVDATTMTTTNFQLLDGSTAVTTTTPAYAGGAQAVSFKPTADLTPGKVYTISVSGVKVDAAPAHNAGQAFAAVTSQFTTQTFHTTAFTAGATNIDRGTTSPLNLFSGLTLAFNLPVDASTVTPDTVILDELSPLGVATRVAGTSYTVTPVVGSTKSFLLKITDAAYTVKFHQQYRVTLTTAIKSASAVALHAEGCTATDCPDSRVTTTSTFAPTLALKSGGTPAVPIGFTVTFNFAVDPTTTDSSLATTMKLYKQVTNTDGTQTLTDTPVTCTTFAASAAKTQSTCTANAALDTNSVYVASAVFLSSAPVKVANPLSGHPTDAASAQFFGNRTGTFRTLCPP